MKFRDLPILKRLIPSIEKRAAPFIWPRGWRVAEYRGALFLVNYFSYLDRRIGFARDWECEQIGYFLNYVSARRPDVFLDIGACGGLYAILVAKSGCCERIVAFEPDPRCRERFLANAHLNNLSGRIEIRAEAVSGQNGTLPFFCETAFAMGKSRVRANGDLTVQCVRLDDALAELCGKRVAIKIDVEGHEVDVVVGMKSILTSNTCFLQMECFDDQVRVVSAKLADFGYRLVHEIGPDKYFANYKTV